MPWLLLLHAVVGIVTVAAGDRATRRALGLALVPPAATLVYAAAHAGAVLDGRPVVTRIGWVPGLDLALDLRLDAFGLVMLALVSGVGLLVVAYASGYFSHPKPGTTRLVGLLTLFAGAMVGLVVADHLLALFLFWELTSVTSYLLIGNDDRDPRARSAALHALLITGAGGLALLVGLVIVGQAAGTYRLSELAASPPSGGAVAAGVACILIGCFTKSAQVPFGAWLPGAMVAPTPVSAYLHSATMVKAGVYLVARLSPIAAGIGVWRPLGLAAGAATMLYGGWRALRQHDLKLLLAFGTVSQLGLLTILFVIGEPAVAQAGVVLLLAHAAFKAALFMVVGIVDHQVGTRDVRGLHGFGRSWRPVLVVAVIGAASMAGLPPLVGFVAKEKALASLLHAHVPGARLAAAAVIVGSVLTVAYSGRFVLGVLGRLGDTDHERRSPEAASPGVALLAPALVLTAVTVGAGLAPRTIDRLVRSATLAIDAGAKPKAVVLWAGFEPALAWSVAIVTAGLALVAGRRHVARVQAAWARIVRPVPTAERTFVASVKGLVEGATVVTAVVQSGSLPIYLAVVLVVVVGVPLVPFATAFDGWPAIVDTPLHLGLAAVVVVAVVGACRTRHRMTAALLLGAIGYAMAGFYVAHGAPDLALTQVAIETLSTVLFVLVLRYLPERWVHRPLAGASALRVVVAGLVGVAMFVFALVAAGSRTDVTQPSVSGEMVERSQPDGKGNNVVNVILVDFRGYDTLGEITVLLVAALGSLSLAGVGLRRAAARRTVVEVPT